MSRLQHTFAELKKRGEAALIPFITAGDPSPQRTLELIRTLAAAGADVIELGVPFSDPMADGPTIQAASERALAAGTTLTTVLDIVAQARRELQIPLVLMGYYNPVFRYGVEKFARDAVAAGVDGLLLVDGWLTLTGSIRGYARGLANDIRVLCAMAQCVIHQYQREHGFYDRCGANANTRVVAAMGLHNGRLSVFVDGASFQANTGSGFDGNIDDNRLSGGNTA